MVHQGREEHSPCTRSLVHVDLAVLHILGRAGPLRPGHVHPLPPPLLRHFHMVTPPDLVSHCSYVSDHLGTHPAVLHLLIMIPVVVLL